MSRSLEQALELIQTRSRQDPDLAAALRTVLGAMLARLPEAVPEPHPVPVPEEDWEPELLTGPAEQEPAYAAWPDLGAVLRNLMLKAQAARWVARYGYTEESEPLKERYALLDEARAVGSYLWMFDRNRVDPDDRDTLTELVDLLELTVQTLTFWQDATDTPEEREADKLLAEAQAALRVAMHRFVRSDDDQHALYTALRLSAQASRTYLPQLSLEYRPRPLRDLQVQLGTLQETKAAREAKERTVKKLRGKARYLTGLVQETPTDMAPWRKLHEVAGELDALGEDVSELLEPLGGVEVPGELPDLAARLAPSPESVPAQPELPRAEETPSADVERVRELLGGHVVVIIGGEPRQDAVTQLEEAFSCRVRWIDSAPHTSLSVFEPAITGEVAAVLLLIRWASHSYGELAGVCKTRNIPLVRLVGGYSPNRVAHDVLEQAEARLEGRVVSQAMD